MGGYISNPQHFQIDPPADVKADEGQALARRLDGTFLSHIANGKGTGLDSKSCQKVAQILNVSDNWYGTDAATKARNEAVLEKIVAGFVKGEKKVRLDADEAKHVLAGAQLLARYRVPLNAVNPWFVSNAKDIYDVVCVDDDTQGLASVFQSLVP